MKTKILAIAGALGVLAFVAVFVWAALKQPPAVETAASQDVPTASASETLLGGGFDVQVFALGDRNVRLEIQLRPDPDAIGISGMRPSVSFSMIGMHDDGFEPPLEMLQADIWRLYFKLPMAGRWLVIVSFGEDILELEFDAD